MASNWAPSIEQFIAWRDDPVTRFVLEACEKAAVDQQREWQRITWDAQGGAVFSEKTLAVLQTRADAYRALAETDYLGWCDMMGVQPNAE